MLRSLGTDRSPKASTFLRSNSRFPASFERIAAEVKRIWELPDVVVALRNVGAEPAPSTPDEFTAYTRAERIRWGEVVKAAGVQIE